MVSSPRLEVADDDWGEVLSTIELLHPFGEAHLQGLADFSHVEVVFVFDRVDPTAVVRAVRRPRGNPVWPEVGIFAQRAKDRPNRLGISTCALEGVEGSTLRVKGLDAVDGTPVLDVKPYMEEFGPRGLVRQPPWARQLMSGYF
ncbi:MAG TPA: SAM-dependent methyltransferase [Acidimicrobiales bacterium]|nr:SAM-dependent methyltransferase [Acidimicrobiales bacterium]